MWVALTFTARLKHGPMMSMRHQNGTLITWEGRAQTLNNVSGKRLTLLSPETLGFGRPRT